MKRYMKRIITVLLALSILVIGFSQSALAGNSTTYMRSSTVTQSWPCYARDVFDFTVMNGKIISCNPYQSKRDLRPFINLTGRGILVYAKNSSYWSVRSRWSLLIGYKGIGADLVNVTCYYRVYPSGRVVRIKKIVH